MKEQGEDGLGCTRIGDSSEDGGIRPQTLHPEPSSQRKPALLGSWDFKWTFPSVWNIILKIFGWFTFILHVLVKISIPGDAFFFKLN